MRLDSKIVMTKNTKFFKTSKNLISQKGSKIGETLEKVYKGQVIVCWKIKRKTIPYTKSHELIDTPTY